MPTFLTILLRLLWRLWQRLTLQPLADPPALRSTMPRSTSAEPQPNHPDRAGEASGDVSQPDAEAAVEASTSERAADELAAEDAEVDEVAQDEISQSKAAEGRDEEPVEPPDDGPLPHAVDGGAQNGTAPPTLPTPAVPAPLVATEGGELPLTSVLESLLFVAEAPIAAAQIAPLLDLPAENVEAGLRTLAQQYRREQRGLRLQQRDGEYALVSAPATANLIERFLDLDLTTKLSGPALETLAIVAYRQPVTRAQVEAVRGVDCSGMLRSLVQRGLVEELGQVDAVGRPHLYGVTDFFMHHFGLTEMGELPPLAAEDADALQAALSLGEEEVGSG